MAILAYDERATDSRVKHIVFGSDATATGLDIESPSDFCKPNTTLTSDLLNLYCTDIKNPSESNREVCVQNILKNIIGTNTFSFQGFKLSGFENFVIADFGVNDPTKFDSAATYGCQSSGCCGGSVSAGKINYTNMSKAFTAVSSTVRLSWGSPLPVKPYFPSPGNCPDGQTCTPLQFQAGNTTSDLHLSVAAPILIAVEVVNCDTGVLRFSSIQFGDFQSYAESTDGGKGLSPNAPLARFINDGNSFGLMNNALHEYMDPLISEFTKNTFTVPSGAIYFVQAICTSG